MAPPQTSLPTKFPCWCRAVYSWGGESTHDLGFIEGDLIECLNAGDGSWWTGKLRRNKTVGVFPSNFVEVLPDSFRPVSRTTAPAASNTPSPTNNVQKAKSKPFRKPFEAYAKAPHYTSAKIPITRQHIPEPAPAPAPKKEPSPSSTISRRRDPHERIDPVPSPPEAHGYGSRAPSPAPPPMHGYGARAPSPAPSMNSYMPRSHSPVPPPAHHYGYRAHSPAPPPMHYHYDTSVPSPGPPPMHHRARSPAPSMHHQYDARAPSPVPSMMHHYHDRGPSPGPPPMHHYDTRAHSPVPPPMHHYDPRAPSPGPPMHHYDARAPSPAPPMHHHYDSRAPSPAPPMHHYNARAPSPAPSMNQYDARAPSPAPSFSYRPYRPEPQPESDGPPPPPPPHRHALLNRENSTASYNPQVRQDGFHTPRAPSPSPGAGEGFTPSPLREAMDGVLDQLDALGMAQGGGAEEADQPPLDPWSPESFDLVHHRSKRRNGQPRPQTSMGLALQDSGYESHSGESAQDSGYQSGHVSKPKEDDGHLPQLSNYVQRMEARLTKMHQHSASMSVIDTQDEAPPPPPKGYHQERPKSSMGDSVASERRMRKQKSAYDIGRNMLGRTSTTRTNSTNASSAVQSTTTNSTQSTERSLMSGTSAGGVSATSAGSYARKYGRARSALGFREGDEDELNRPTTPFSGISYHPSHSTSAQRPQSQAAAREDGIGSIGGLVQPESTKPKKSNFIKRILEATKTGVASGRSSIATGAGSMQSSPLSRMPNGMTAISGGRSTPNLSRETAREMGMAKGVDWVQVRRDVNRSNTLSKNERTERMERCQMLDYPAIDPVDELYESVEGSEAADGHAVREPINYQTIHYGNVDKNTRFVASLPPMTTSVSLATTYVCRPYRSEVQRLRAIFMWVAEKINWEEDFEGEMDTRRAIQSKRGCAEEYALLVHEMCAAVGIHSEMVRGYLKTPGEIPETGFMPRPNHWWNAVLVDNEWRMMDCCLASPSNPRRSLYSSSHSQAADPWWFLVEPMELCWTHIPEHHAQQHICPPVAHEILLNLPCACPPFFKQSLSMVGYNTSLTRIEDLEMCHVKFNVPADVEVAAEVEVRAFTRDTDGDYFESGEIVKKRALAQAEWFNGVKRYTVKALLPGDEGNGTLKIYAGKRGLMHSIKDIPHPLAFALPIIHTGENPPYEFVTRHPTPHAQRHDIYVVQPQCQRLALNNTFVFAIRQHPNQNSIGISSNPGGTSPMPFGRPTSAMSMTSSSAAGGFGMADGGSTTSSGATGTVAGKKPAKLAIQTPGGKILRLMRKEERRGAGIGVGIGSSGRGTDEEVSDGGTWETIIKCSERGTWRGLVLADRTARWCVFAEWTCEG